MDKFWKWLMKMDAKGLFAASVVVFAGVLVWCATDQIRSAREARGDAPPPSPDAAERAAYVPLGILDFIGRQFAPETLIVPVNPFHPSYEEIVRAIMEKSESGEIEIIDENGNKVKVHFEGKDLVAADGRKIESPFQRDLTPKAPNTAGHSSSAALSRPKPSAVAQHAVAQKPKPKPGHGRALRYSGIMQRPDGQFAAYVVVYREEDKGRAGRFVAVGDEIEGATVKSVGRDSIELSLRDGNSTTLNMGDKPFVVR